MTRKEGRDPETDEAAADSEPASETPTVLVDGDDRTQLVARSSESPNAETSDAQLATRVIDPAAPPAPPAGVAADGAAYRASPSPTPIDGTLGLVPGTVLFGEYEIVNVLGVGGMGEVYRARHRRLDEYRAIKVMHSELSTKKGASEFFYREAKALLAVRHPAVVHCHDLLSDEDGRVYLIMEMIEGIPLSKKMSDGPLSPDDVAILGARIAHGLTAAHLKGVIHRDVSPDNIVLPNGRVQEAKLIDFGIAKILQQGEGTIIDGFKGKLSYASPEQLGFFGGKIDGRSDFYSLGLVLAAAALGRPMNMGKSVMEAVDARRNLGSLPDEIPIGLRSAIQPLLALDPDDRPKYVDRLFVVPGGMAVGTDSDGYGAGPAATRGASPKRVDAGQVRLFAGFAAAGAVVVGGGLYFGAGGEAPIETTSSPPIEDVLESVVENDPSPTVAVEELAPDSVKEPEVVARVESPKTPVRRLSARDRIKIIGLLSNARLALGENQLMSPVDDNAYDRYRRVLALDSRNQKAKDGLREVASRYLSLTDAAVAKGDLTQAATYLDRARKADPTHPGISSAQSRLTR